MCRDGPVNSTYRNKAGMKINKKTTLLRNDGGIERQEDYPTSAEYTADVG